MFLGVQTIDEYNSLHACGPGNPSCHLYEKVKYWCNNESQEAKYFTKPLSEENKFSFEIGRFHAYWVCGPRGITSCNTRTGIQSNTLDLDSCLHMYYLFFWPFVYPCNLQCVTTKQNCDNNSLPWFAMLVRMKVQSIQYQSDIACISTCKRMVVKRWENGHMYFTWISIEYFQMALTIIST